MKKALLSALTTASLCVAGPMWAQEVGQWYVAPQLSGIYVDRKRNLDDDLGFQFGIGRVVSEGWNVELNLEGAGFDGPVSTNIFGIGANALKVWYRQSTLHPYLLLGVGLLDTDPEFGPTETDLMGNVGFGLLGRLGESGLILRAEARGRAGFNTGSNDDTLEDLVLSLGLQFPVGRVRAVAVDSDGDGVLDDADLCPGTPLGTPVDANGCPRDSDGDGVTDDRDECPGTPARARVDARGCELDSDGDGVVDSRDQCPDTPRGVKVDANGCPPDSDRDGIADHEDLCPNTPGLPPTGCPREEIRLQGVNFELNSAELTPESLAVLDTVAGRLKRRTDVRVEVAGHTDSSGSDAYNQNLSQRRAQSVVDYLVAQGIDPSQLVARGYGETQPVADNATAAGRAENRRVALRVLQ